MGLAFFILEALASLFGVVYIVQKLFSPRRGVGSPAPGFCVLAVFLGFFVALFFPSDVRFFSIDHFKNKVVSVDGPNAFSVKVGRKVPLVLSGTIAPAGAAEAQKAEQFLRGRLLGKKVAVDFPAGDKRRPRQAVVFLDKANFNEIMVSEGLLQRVSPAPAAAATPAAVAQADPGTVPGTAAAVAGAPKASGAPATAKPKRPPSPRFFIWFIAGCIGAAFFSRALLGRKVGLDLFLAFVLLALRDMALAVRADTSLAPPLVALAIAVIAGPGMKSADFWASLRERSR
jgi:hypothetical protein